MKPGTQSPNVFLGQIPLAVQHVGDDAFGPEHVHKVLLAKPVNFHQVPDDVKRPSLGHGVIFVLRLLGMKSRAKFTLGSWKS